MTRKNSGLQSTLPLTISAIYGLVDQQSFFNKIVAGENLAGYYLIKNGEFAYNKSSSSDYPWGAIKRLNNHSEGVLSTLYIYVSLLNPAFVVIILLNILNQTNGTMVFPRLRKKARGIMDY